MTTKTTRTIKATATPRGAAPHPGGLTGRAGFRTFRIDSLVFSAKDKVDGVLVDPKLPKAFDSTPNDERSPSHQRWWGLPYVVTSSVEEWDRYYAERTDEWAEKGREHWAKGRPEWMAAWPSGTRYEVRCLDGGAWDRSTSWGMFATLAAAIACAKSGAPWRRRSGA
jgi:hypothetical protein